MILIFESLEMNRPLLKFSRNVELFYSKIIQDTSIRGAKPSFKNATWHFFACIPFEYQDSLSLTLISAPISLYDLYLTEHRSAQLYPSINTYIFISITRKNARDHTRRHGAKPRGGDDTQELQAPWLLRRFLDRPLLSPWYIRTSLYLD